MREPTTISLSSISPGVPYCQLESPVREPADPVESVDYAVYSAYPPLASCPAYLLDRELTLFRLYMLPCSDFSTTLLKHTLKSEPKKYIEQQHQHIQFQQLT